MKSKLRAITVDGHAFYWRVVRLTQACVLLRVWLEGEKRSPWAEVTCEVDDLWLSLSDVIGSNSSKSGEAQHPTSLLPR
jgi:hypothetical protein